MLTIHDEPLPVLGVHGRITHRTTKPNQPPGLWFRQRWISARRPVAGHGDDAQLSVELKFDDDCGNGHNTFAITGDIYGPAKMRHGRHSREIIGGGCVHDEIAEVFPELAPLIKWHLVSTDGPMHYEANTVYLAGNRDYHGKRKGEPVSFEQGIRFDSVPITHRIGKRFFEFLQGRVNSGGEFRPVAIAHEREPETFTPNYTIAGYGKNWYECPWNDKTAATEFCEALNKCAPEFVTIPTRFSEGKARELDAARRAACWPNATDAELSAEPEKLRAKLQERLPALMAEFRRDIEAIGFYWSPEDCGE